MKKVRIQKPAVTSASRLVSLLRRPASRDAIAGRGIHVEIFNPGLPAQIRLERVYNAVVVLAMMSLRVLLVVPEADGDDLVGIILRHQANQIYESWLLLEKGQHLTAKSVF